MAERMSFSSNLATTVWMAMRSLGGVSMTLMSRRPISDMCSVRGMGVADMVSTSTVVAHLLQPLFVANAEALLFIDDEQAEVLKLQIFREQAMRADEDIDLARLDFLEDLFLLLRRAEARDHLDVDGKAGEALLEGLVVLEGEDGRRGEHRDLLVVLHGLEGGAHGDFGLAVANIAAEQAVHRLGGFHVALDVGDGVRAGRRSR